MQAGSRTQTEMIVNIRVKIGDETVPFKIQQSSTVKGLKNASYEEKRIPPERQRLVLPLRGTLRDAELVSGICKGGELLHLEGAVDIAPSADDESGGGKTKYDSNTSHDQSTQVNGSVHNGDQPPLMSKGKTTYIQNASRDKSTQVNGPVSGIDIFKRNRNS